MEGFTYDHHHHPSLLDSAYYPNTPIEMAFSNNFPSCFHNYCSSSEATPEASAAHDAFSYDSSSSLNNGSRAPAVSLATKHHLSMEKKRKNLNGTSKESKGSNKSKRQKKSSGGLKGTEENLTEEPPAGYIHVRARRGQATDSHSLAERVRRERISERMKMLQGLVPGCERVAGKALVLDEIINYVQSLQNQVEFLSMRLASLNPMVYGLGEGFDNSMNQQESTIQAIPSGFQPNIGIQPITFENATNDYPMMHEPTTFSQDNESFLVQVGDSRQQVFLDQVEFSNMCTFH